MKIKEPSAYDTTVRDLCEQVDYWKSEAKYWEEEFKTLQKTRIQEINKRIKSTEEQIGVILGASLEGTFISNDNLKKLKEKDFTVNVND